MRGKHQQETLLLHHYIFGTTLVIDRFHVMKVVNQDLNKLRRAAEITDRGSKYLLLSNRSNLNKRPNSKVGSELEKIRMLENCV